MDGNQSISNNYSATSMEVSSQQASSSNKLFVAVIISVLIAAAIAGLAVYFWQKSQSEKEISGLEQKISSLERQLSSIKRGDATPRSTPPLILSPSPTSIISIPSPSPTLTTNSTTGWQMYVNTKYKYSISYPFEYKLGSCRNCFDLSTADFITLDPSQQNRYGRIMISRLRDRKEEETLEEYLDNISGVDANPIVLGSKKRYRLNGYEVLATVTSNYGYESKNVFVTNGNNVIHSSFSGVASSSNKGLSLEDYDNIDVFDKMLLTFKFTD